MEVHASNAVAERIRIGLSVQLGMGSQGNTASNQMAQHSTSDPSKTVEDLICKVNGAKVFSKLDIAKAFHQLMLALECRNATKITTHIGLFRYARLHMGISCASEIFTEEVRLMLADLPWQVNMIDDTLVFGRDEAEHQKNDQRAYVLVVRLLKR